MLPDEKELGDVYYSVESMLEEYIDYYSVGLPLRVLLDLKVEIPLEGSSGSKLRFKLDMVAPGNLVEGSREEEDEERAEEWEEKIKSEIRVLSLSLVFLLKPIGEESVERERYLGIVSFPFFVVRSEESNKILPKTISYNSSSVNAYISLVDKREVGKIEPIYLESVELPENTNLPGFGVRVEGDGVKFSFYNYKGERVGKSELVRGLKEAIALSGKWGTMSTTFEVARAMSMIYSYYNDEFNSICVDDGRGKRVLISPKVSQDEVLTFILEKLVVGVLQKMKENKDKYKVLQYLKEHHFNWVLLLEAYQKNSLDEIVWAIKRGFLNYHFVIRDSTPIGKAGEEVELLDLKRYGKVGVLVGEDERYWVFVS
ncbi:putative major surface glycoprotein [Thermus phage phiLo]|nr:putative major surface glycoprotein [Thermus phage phiLo]